MAVRHVAGLIPVSSTGVVVNLVCPGFCKTELIRNGQPAMREYLTDLHKQAGRTAQDGSRPLLHGAVAGKDSHGCFLQSCAIDE
jgi:NAD(P)-dependent dehydrogenase (short-subunit alcohol dehydrogenase family)